MTDTELERLIFEEPPPIVEFHPNAIYSRQGDCIEFLISNESFRAERLDHLVTVYYGRESRDVVGSLIKGVSSFIAEMIQRNPGFRIDIEGGRVKLSHLFTARIWKSEVDPEGTKTLVYLRQAAETEDVQVELDMACA